MFGRSFYRDWDLNPSELSTLLELAVRLKADKSLGREEKFLTGKNICLIFEKSSTRTRCSFEVAAYDQGANLVHLDPQSSHFLTTESVKDSARVFGRLFDAIGYRGSEQSRVEDIGRWANVPIWNCMTNAWHPTQGLADMLTMREHSTKPWNEIKAAFVGDGHSNIANSLVAAGSSLGMDIRVVSPSEYPLNPEVLSEAQTVAAETGGKVTYTTDIDEGVEGVDFICADIWIWLKVPVAQWMERFPFVKNYQVTKETLEKTGNPDVKFLHCLPAVHNLDSELAREFHAQTGWPAAEVTDEVFESPASVVFDQAENRMHTIKALMVSSLSKDWQ